MSASVTFKEYMDLGQFAEFEKKYKNISYQYLTTSLMAADPEGGVKIVVMTGFSPIAQYDNKFISEKICIS